MTPDRHEAFLSARYWPQLDGLRVISIAVVLVAHMGDKWVPTFKGALGVVIFFVISGFLITSLLIREEARTGRASISRFYVRRVFRIVPLYAVALGIATALVLVAGFGEDPDQFRARLPLLATFNGDFAGGGTFVHSWSIGIEEKFYVIWPLVGFAFLALAKRRAQIAAAFLVVCGVAAFIPTVDYMGTYTGIVAGCVLAIAMHSERSKRAVQILASRTFSAVTIVLVVALFVADKYLPWTETTGFSHVPFALAVALAFPGILMGGTWTALALSWKPLVYVGTRTYGIYLFHPFVIDGIGFVIDDGQQNVALGIVRLLLAFVCSLLVAEVAYRVLEAPAIRLGRRLSGNMRSPREVPSGAHAAGKR